MLKTRFTRDFLIVFGNAYLQGKHLFTGAFFQKYEAIIPCNGMLNIDPVYRHLLKFLKVQYTVQVV